MTDTALVPIEGLVLAATHTVTGVIFLVIVVAVVVILVRDRARRRG